MTLVMAYAVLLSSVVAGAAALFDLLARRKRLPTRWTWLVALSLLVSLTAFVMIAPQDAPAVTETPAASGPIAGVVPPSRTPGLPAPGLLERGDILLGVGWALMSVVLLLAIAIGRWRVAAARRRAERLELQGHPVLLTEDLGPAVAGVRAPVVFIPRWVVTLDDASQRLLLAHELEHVRRGDTRVLMAAAVLTALLPWNPVAWWIARRLRIAVELDCDRRVLAMHPGVRRYADLLLLAAGKPAFASRFLAAHFGENASDLERRLEAMTTITGNWRSMLATAVVTSVLFVVACEAPRPEPVAPLGSESGKVAVQAADVLYEFQVEKPVTMLAGSRMPKYPDILREAGVEGEVLAAFVVDESGKADESSLKVVRSTHELFTAAVREVLPATRFTAAEVGGRKVKQMVQQPFSFTLAGTAKASGSTSSSGKGSSEEVRVTGVPAGKRLAFMVRRGDQVASPPPDVVVVSFDGKELARGEGLLDKIEPQSIHSVEVFKPTQCPSTMTCPMIKIRLAMGKSLPR